MKNILIIVCALIAYVILSYSFSFQSGILSQFVGGGIYFLLGVISLQFKIKRNIDLGLFLMPLAIIIIISFDNTNLFPVTCPILLLVCIISFFLARKMVTFYLEDQVKKAILLFTIYCTSLIFGVYQFIVPILYNEFQAPVTELKIIDKKVAELDTIRLQDKNGRFVKLSKKSNDLLLMDFWFSGCGICYLKNQHFNELAQKYKDKKNVKFYIVTIGNSDSFEKFLETTKNNPLPHITYLYDTNGYWKKMLNISSVPSEVIFYKGKVIRKLVGYNADIENIYRYKTESIINNSLK